MKVGRHGRVASPSVRVGHVKKVSARIGIGSLDFQHGMERCELMLLSGRSAR